ncbi:hypothetical protein [Brevundimonas sp.]|jgi:hypothetical protein|uniref:hypothetical protein n=1 Tax=Brevundimonas sp. TaxID=1871086 RepID=UPI0037BED2B9
MLELAEMVGLSAFLPPRRSCHIPDMTLRQRHLWIAILVTVAVWGLYAWVLVSAVIDGGLNREGFAGEMGGLFVLGLLLIGVAEGVLNLIARLLPRRDQREGAAEKRAALEASHLSLMALIGLVAALAATLFCFGLFGGGAIQALLRVAIPANLLVLLANLLMGCVVLSELARFATTLYLLPRR